MKRWMLIFAISALAGAQDINLQTFDALRAKATDTVEVNLSESMLHMAAGFMNGNDSKQAEMKKLVGGLKGVYVRSFKFDKDGQYSAADVEAMRDQLKAAGWQSMVDVHQSSKAKEGTQNSGVYLRTDGKQVMGLVVLASEPKQLTLVNIAGNVDLAQLQALSGTLGIPPIRMGFDGKQAGSKTKE